MQRYDGNPGRCDGRFAVVVSRFNESITARLLDGAVRDARWPTACADDQIDVAWVPGAFEIPTVAGRLAAAGRYAACSAWAR